MTLAVVFGGLSIAVALFWFSVLIAVLFVKDALNPIYYTVSETGCAAQSRVYIMLSWFAASALGVCMAIAFSDYFNTFGGGVGNATGSIVALSVFAVARLLTWVFPSGVFYHGVERGQHERRAVDPRVPGGSRSTSGVPHSSATVILHAIFAIISFLSFCASAVVVGSEASSSLVSTSLLFSVRIGSDILGYIGFGALVMTVVGGRVFGVPGVFERMFYVVMITWFLFMGAVLVQGV